MINENELNRIELLENVNSCNLITELELCVDIDDIAYEILNSDCKLSNLVKQEAKSRFSKMKITPHLAIVNWIKTTYFPELKWHEDMQMAFEVNETELTSIDGAVTNIVYIDFADKRVISKEEHDRLMWLPF